MLPIVTNAAYAAVLVVLAVSPRLPTAGVRFSDHWLHGLAYGLEAAFAYWLVWPLTSRLGAAVIAWLGASGLGLSTEVLQGLTRGRSAEVGDLLADMVGASLVVFALLGTRRLVNAYRVTATGGGDHVRA
jgi:VanZ family protein